MGDAPDNRDPDVTSTQLPGVGDRHEFRTAGGDALGVVRHRGGDRELVVFSRDDPDSCKLALRLSGEEARRLAAMLGEGRSDRPD